MLVTKTSLHDDIVQHLLGAAVQRISKNMSTAADLLECAWDLAETNEENLILYSQTIVKLSTVHVRLMAAYNELDLIWMHFDQISRYYADDEDVVKGYTIADLRKLESNADDTVSYFQIFGVYFIF
jgi:hypothetical protein